MQWHAHGGSAGVWPSSRRLLRGDRVDDVLELGRDVALTLDGDGAGQVDREHRHEREHAHRVELGVVRQPHARHLQRVRTRRGHAPCMGVGVHSTSLPCTPHLAASLLTPADTSPPHRPLQLTPRRLTAHPS